MGESRRDPMFIGRCFLIKPQPHRGGMFCGHSSLGNHHALKNG
jgi:hypothetical protein